MMTTLRREGVYLLPGDKFYVARPAKRQGRHFLYSRRDNFPLIPDYVMSNEGYVLTWPDEQQTPWSSHSIIDTGETYRRSPPASTRGGLSTYTIVLCPVLKAGGRYRSRRNHSSGGRQGCDLAAMCIIAAHRLALPG